MLVRADVNIATLNVGIIAELAPMTSYYHLVIKLAQFLLQHSFLDHKKIFTATLNNLETFLAIFELGNVMQNLNLALPIRTAIKKMLLIHMLLLHMWNRFNQWCSKNVQFYFENVHLSNSFMCYTKKAWLFRNHNVVAAKMMHAIDFILMFVNRKCFYFQLICFFCL